MPIEFKYPRAKDCPDASTHMKCPDDFVEWYEWAEKQSETHDQLQCPTCGFWSIWIEKRDE